MAAVKTLAATATLLTFASRVLAIASTCPTSDICYQLSVPDATASSGTGDIYFQLSAPTSYQWVALGQGTQMSGSNIFVMYTSASGSNVTVSQRLGTGHVMPQHDTATQITLLDGSGVSNGVMTANVLCSNCNSWSGGKMDFTGSSSNWIHAYKSGSAMNTDDLDASISQHDDHASFSLDLSKARGGSDVNPFVNSAAGTASTGAGTTAGATATATAGSGTTATSGSDSGATACTAAANLASPSGSGCPTAWPSSWSTAWPTARPTWASSCFASGHPAWPTDAPWQYGPPGSNGNSKRQEDCTSSGTSSFSNNGFFSLSAAQQNRIITVHAVLACLAFVALFPLGGILIRIANFTGLLWVHALLQLFAYLVYLVAFGIGVWMASSMDLLTSAHPIIGIVLFIVLLFQPVFGLVHHKLYKKYSRRTIWSYLHLNIGRVAILLGMVNGGLGLQLAAATRPQIIAYSVVAVIVGLVYIVCAVVGEMRRRRNSAPPPSYETSQKHVQLRDMSGSERSLPREHYGKVGGVNVSQDRV